MNRLVVCLLSVFSHLIADDIRPFCILTDREGAGMFSMFSDVLALVDCYDRGIFQGVEIDFGEKGLYWVKNYGPNWWNYYSEPISLGEKNNVFKGEYSELPNMARRYDYKDRKEAYNLIEKYIHFRPYLLKEVENFVHAHFDGCYVIGIHYRGTDAGGLSYDLYFNKIRQITQLLKKNDYKIFVATDDQSFIDDIIEKFPNRVCFQQQILRSSDQRPLHFNAEYNLCLQGKEALIDCLLLSKSSCLILSFSNLSLWAALLNPYIPALDVSKSLPIVNLKGNFNEENFILP